MEQPRWGSEGGWGPGLGDTVPLETVRAEIEEIERIAGSITDLTAVLRARLTPADFRLVWELRDAVERLAIAEGVLREQRLADELARCLPDASAALQVMRRHLREDGLAVDEDA